MLAGLDKAQDLHAAVWESQAVHQEKLLHLESKAVREQITQRVASVSLEFSKIQLDKSRANLTQRGD